MTWEFDVAANGNVALIGELDLSRSRDFTLGLAFGDHLHDAATSLFHSLGVPFDEHETRFNAQWERACRDALPLETAAGDGGRLYRSSHAILRAHEDKNYSGAMIASLSIPWGDAKGDEDLGGYHLVWPRDMVNTTTALLASGNRTTPLRALIYLAVAQRADGGFYQNFWLDGEPYWQGVQLDEVAFPILLAWKLHRQEALADYDPYPMVRSAAAYLVRHGPATQQERWEENAGYSPSTLAVNIAALVCASLFARERGEIETADFLLDYADFLECHVERWTVTDQGTLLPDVPRHYIRIHPVDPADSTSRREPQSRHDRDQEPSARRRARVPGQGNRRCGLSRAGAIRRTRRRRRAGRGLAARRRRAAEGGHAGRAGLAALQPRRLRRGRAGAALRRLGRRPCLAAADRRARSLRTGRRPRSGALHPGARGFRLGLRAAARAGLGPSRRAGEVPLLRQADRRCDAVVLGPRRVRQTAALSEGRPRLRSGAGGRRPLSRRAPRVQQARDLEVQPSGRHRAGGVHVAGPGRRSLHLEVDAWRVGATRTKPMQLPRRSVSTSSTSTSPGRPARRSVSRSSGPKPAVGKAGTFESRWLEMHASAATKRVLVIDIGGSSHQAARDRTEAAHQVAVQPGSHSGRNGRARRAGKRRMGLRRCLDRLPRSG